MKTKKELPACPVATSVSLIGGKWKLMIIRNLRSRPEFRKGNWQQNKIKKVEVEINY